MSSFKLLVALIPAFAAAACVGPAVNDATLDLLKGYEKMIPNPYDDGYGNPTIGYGHLCQDFSCSDVSYSQPLTEETATKLLADDLEGFQDAVTNAFADAVTLNDNQYGALVSWTFNVGAGGMQSSSLVRRMNNGEDVDVVAEEELPKWVHANGAVSEGLVNRRNAELELFATASKGEGLPAPC
ncbi:lysozyme-like protein [Aspergillus steynii IBT 23096]|uniref:Lysozyme-like protein n=1 Tax=Aspergillus steynii IBT 23096 TaxID=1392250 RepID=A0A2I2G7V6_9EURO|nr:lysozyme-like protein [Aspergillus steynii IBT 23096]PLB48966.1 lysozyme-like protein [Aspergillus steynii IBT 23096]